MNNVFSVRWPWVTARAAQPARERSKLLRIGILIARFLRGQRTQFLLAAAALTVEAITAIFQVYPLAYLIDYLQGHRQPVLPAWGLPTIVSPLVDTVAVLTLGMVLLAMINSSGDSLSEIFLARGGRMLGYNLRVALYAHLQQLSLAFHANNRTGDLMTRVTGDVLAIEDFVINSLAGFAMAVFLLIGTVIYLVYHSWQAALIALLLIPLLALVTLYFSRRIAALAVVQRRNEGGLASATQEMLTSIRLIQTYGSAEYEQSRFAGQNEVRMSSTLARARLQAQFTWVMSVLQALAIAAIIWLGLWLVGRSTITVGTLVLFVMLIQNMFKPLRRIIKEWNRLGKVYACVERIGDLIDRVPAVANAPDARVAPHLEGRVEFRQVSFKYGHAGESGPGETSTPHEARMALKQVSLTVGPGEVLALVGPTGAGKSSVIQLLPRLYDPTTGQILLDEQDIRTFTLDSLRRQMSMVLQETILFNGTVAENIAYAAPHISREQIIVAAQAANAHEFIERLPDGYDTILSERGANLSGGQRQRIAIARAFIRDTPILILDEPTTGLDAAATDTVMAALRRLMPGKTTILVSHDFNLIREATKILVIEDGTIVETGTHASLLKSHGLYADLYHRQFSASAATPSDLVAQPA